MDVSKKPLAVGIAVVLIGIALVLVPRVSGSSLQQSEERAEEVWTSALPAELQARLYEFAILIGAPAAVATSPEAIWSIDDTGNFEPVLQLSEGPQGGESATVSADGSRAGILIHEGHAVRGFKLVDLQGNVLAAIESPLNFHYRVAPFGDTFVAIDAEGEHVQVNADRFLYTFYDERGERLAEVISKAPQPMDSAYSPDGQVFVINNAGGVHGHNLRDGSLRWSVPKPAFMFAAANAPSEIVLISEQGDRKSVESYRGGERLWEFSLDANVANIAISPNGEFMLATDSSTAHFLTPEDGSPGWSFEMPDKDLIINSVAVNDGGVVALGAQREELNGGVLIVLDSGGKQMFEREFTYELSNAWIPTVQFDPKGVFLLARTLEELVMLSTE